MVEGSGGRSLSAFTVELEVYSGPYEWLLALIMKDELEIFEVPLRELVRTYLEMRNAPSANALERDTEFVGSASALVLLKSRTLLPAVEVDGDGGEEDPSTPEELAGRLTEYLKVRRAAEALRERLVENTGHYPSGHALAPRTGEQRVDPRRVEAAARKTFSRLTEPPVRHLGPITVTVQELADLIRASLRSGPLSYEELVRGMDRLRAAVAFSAALSLAQEGRVLLRQQEPLGPLTLEPVP